MSIFLGIWIMIFMFTLFICLLCFAVVLLWLMWLCLGWKFRVKGDDSPKLVGALGWILCFCIWIFTWIFTLFSFVQDEDGWSHRRHVWIVIEVWRSVEKLCTDETFKSVILIDGYCRYDKQQAIMYSIAKL